MNKLITITGKVRVLPAGHKVNGASTWYRDADGNFHAEFYKASVGQVEEDGKYHSYSFNVDTSEAEAFANMPIGTTFKCELVPKMETRVDDNGNEVTVPKTRLSDDKATVYHDAVLNSIELAKEGVVKRPRVTQYFADVKYEDPKEAKANEAVAE